MPTHKLIPCLRLLDQRTSWRRSELPPQIARDVLNELDRFKLIEIRLWTRFDDQGMKESPALCPNRKYGREGWYFVGEKCNQLIAGTIDETWAHPMYQGDREPEFRVSPTGGDWLRDADKAVAQPDGSDSNAGNKTEIIMGDKYENLRGSTVVSRSEVKSSFNRTRDDHSTKGATGGVWKWLTTGLWTFVQKRFGW